MAKKDTYRHLIATNLFIKIKIFCNYNFRRFLWDISSQKFIIVSWNLFEKVKISFFRIYLTENPQINFRKQTKHQYSNINFTNSGGCLKETEGRITYFKYLIENWKKNLKKRKELISSKNTICDQIFHKIQMETQK